ncbi:hypothetical protein, partial [Escherichia coli]|uniref:hypothetical protein n=1 Tax=Escherichia coli TaxID=562 RepID=UPI0019652DCA
RRLDPLNNAADLDIVRNNRPWNEWWENYTKTNYDLNKWNNNWNPVRRPKVSMFFDRIGCETNKGWDPLMIPWDAPEIRIGGDGVEKSLITLSALYRYDVI